LSRFSGSTVCPLRGYPALLATGGAIPNSPFSMAQTGIASSTCHCDARLHRWTGKPRQPNAGTWGADHVFL